MTIQKVHIRTIPKIVRVKKTFQRITGHAIANKYFDCSLNGFLRCHAVNPYLEIAEQGNSIRPGIGQITLYTNPRSAMLRACVLLTIT